MDLDPALQVSGVKLNTSVIGFGEHQMMFNGSSPEDGRLFLSIYSIYDEALKSLDPSEVIGIFLGRELSAMEDSGDSITGNWTAVSAAGQNVTVFTLSTPNPRVTFSSYDMAMWPLDEDSYVMMASVMQKDATERVINTLTFV
ncbi:MAG: hypothetical protein GKC10_09815 [Methanosarcinales archaeon]|nr:hypothetical protein [Methanosarcinales archaeon]